MHEPYPVEAASFSSGLKSKTTTEGRTRGDSTQCLTRLTTASSIGLLTATRSPPLGTSFWAATGLAVSIRADSMAAASPRLATEHGAGAIGDRSFLWRDLESFTPKKLAVRLL